MANPVWYNEDYYLNSKLAQLQTDGGINAGQPDTSYNNINDVKTAILNAGMTTFQHFSLFSLNERTSPNEWFNTVEYLAAKAVQLNAAQGVTTWTGSSVGLALQNAGYSNAYDHFHQFGWKENVNPSNDFDVSDYLASKAAATGLTVAQVQQALIAAGQDPVQNWMGYGVNEPGMVVTPVPESEAVHPQVNSIFTLTTGQDVLVGPGNGNDIFTGTNEGETSTFTLGDSLDGGVGGIDQLIIANDADDLMLVKANISNMEVLEVVNVYDGFSTLDIHNDTFTEVIVDYKMVENNDDLYIDNINGTTNLTIENVTAGDYTFYRNYDEVYDRTEGSVSVTNTIQNLDVRGYDIFFDGYEYFEKATEINTTLNIKNIDGLVPDDSGYGFGAYDYIDSGVDGAVVNSVINVSNAMTPGDGDYNTYVYVDGSNSAGTSTYNVTANLTDSDSLDFDYTAYDSSDEDVITYNVDTVANNSVNENVYSELWSMGFEEVNVNVTGDSEFNYFGDDSDQGNDIVVNIDAAADFIIAQGAYTQGEDHSDVDSYTSFGTGEDGGSFGDVTINVTGAGEVDLGLAYLGDGEEGDVVTVNAAAMTGDFSIEDRNGYAESITSGSGDDHITAWGAQTIIETNAGDDLVNIEFALEANDDADGALGSYDGGADFDTFEISAANAIQSELNLTDIDFADAIRNFELLSLTAVDTGVVDSIKWGLGDNVTLDGAGDGFELIVNDAANVELTGDATALVLTVDGAADADDASLNLTINGVDGVTAAIAVADVETINFVSSASDPDVGSNDVALTAAETVILNISGVEALDFTGSIFADIETVAAAGFNAGLTIDVSAALQDVAITIGSGDDVVVGSDFGDTINAGNGDNLVTGLLGGDDISVGTGVNQLIYLAAADSTGAATDTVINFNAADVNADPDVEQYNVFNLDAIDGDVVFLGNFANANVANTALQAGSGTLQVVFVENENFIYADANDNGVVDEGDLAIQLVGLTGTLSQDNFTVVV